MIEIVRPQLLPGDEYLRIRNDSPYPVQIFEIEFRWRLKGSRTFSEFYTPMVWILGGNSDRTLLPGHSFEHPIDPHKVGLEVTHGRILVEHNRSNRIARKTFRVRGPVG